MTGSFIQTVEGDLLDVASHAMQYVETKILGYGEEVLTDLRDLIDEALKDIKAGDSVDVIVTKVLNLAESRGKSLILEVGSDIIAAFASLAKMVPTS
jgi:hypothetical protein